MAVELLQTVPNKHVEKGTNGSNSEFILDVIGFGALVHSIWTHEDK
jgi:hypothetical protein